LCDFGAAKISKCGKLERFSKLIESRTLLIGISAEASIASFGRFLLNPEEKVLSVFVVFGFCYVFVVYWSQLC